MLWNMPNAWITLRHEPPYRSGSFAHGLERVGYSPILAFPEPKQVKADDVVVTWNLNPRYRPAADAALNSGASLIVAENGYVHRRGSSEPYYALARNGHNGSGFWFVGKRNRFEDLRHGFAPWREPTKGSYILVANQRGIGSDLMKCPRDFADKIRDRIDRVYHAAGFKKSPKVVIREHPGRHKAQVELSEHLREARACVSWASNTLNIACLAGIPSFHIAPYHVNDAVIGDLSLLPNPPETDRDTAFNRLAWAQWSLSEINDGTAFRCLLQDVL